MSSAPAATRSLASAASTQREPDFGHLLEDFRRQVDGQITRFLDAKRSAWVRQARSEGGGGPHRLETPHGSSGVADPVDLVNGVADLLAVGGKRLRPALVYFTYCACGGEALDQVMPLALATELLHTYLLIHDDIMDHAATRRGQPAAHVRFAAAHRAAALRGDADDFGRSAALLLGDLAHTYAGELFTEALWRAAAGLAQVGPPAPTAAMAPLAPPAPMAPLASLAPPSPIAPPVPLSAAALGELRRCYADMCDEVIGGQYLEYLLAHRPGDPESPAAPQAPQPPQPPQPSENAAPAADRTAELWRILRLKSGRYTAERPIQLGALLAGASPALRTELSRYGTAVGEAFQLQDDILGVFGDPAATGKPVGDDLREGKYTFLVHHALDALHAPHAPHALNDLHALNGDETRQADRRFLLAALGDPHLTAAAVARAQSLIEDTGARRIVAAMIDERLALARRALDAAAAHLGGATASAQTALAFLGGLLDYLRERDQ